MNAFFGYGPRDAAPSYHGVQCHGVLWPADPASGPGGWPLAPPMVSGKVNVATRAAATHPGACDALAAFAGAYSVHALPDAAGGAPAELADVVIEPDGRGERGTGARRRGGWGSSGPTALCTRAPPSHAHAQPPPTHPIPRLRQGHGRRHRGGGLGV